jgi:hypothetical protein
VINLRPRLYAVILLAALTFIINFTAMAQDADKDKSPSIAPGPSGSEMVHVGPLEITPSRANLVLKSQGDQTYLIPTIRFKIFNNSLSDVKVIIFKRSINVCDNLGETLFNSHEIVTSGIISSEKGSDQFSKAFTDEKGKFIILSPKQIFEAQLTTSGARQVNDKEKEFFRNHRPKTITVSATIGIINIDNTPELRAFSFSDLPVTVSTR